MPSSDARDADPVATESGRGRLASALGWRALVPVVAAVVALDWLTKAAVAGTMPYGSAEALVPGFFNLVHARNPGIAFSLFADSAPWFRDVVLPAVSLAAVGIIAFMFRKLHELPAASRVALALVLAGAVGNLSERLLHGYVTDFLDFYVGAYHWPAFNVADSAITVGATLLILESFLGRHRASEAGARV